MSLWAIISLWHGKQNMRNGQECFHYPMNFFFFHLIRLFQFERSYLSKFYNQKAVLNLICFTLLWNMDHIITLFWHGPFLYGLTQIKLKNAGKITSRILVQLTVISNRINYYCGVWFIAKIKFISIEIFFQTRN